MGFWIEDTITAPATVSGTGAISIIRLSGKDSFAVTDKVVSFSSGSCAAFDGYTIHYGSIYMSGGDLLDNVLVSVFRAPHSYTGEDIRLYRVDGNQSRPCGTCPANLSRGLMIA